MVYALTWLPSVLEGAGLKVAEVDGWRSRGRAEMGTVRGVICHHTAGVRAGNMPSLGALIRGRSDLSGPLAQLGLGRDGTYYVVAAGRANHAGEGRWRGYTGNSAFIGIEAENTGKADDLWPEVQMDAYRRGVAAILAHIGADAGMCCGHKEYAPDRKPDPLFDMAVFRQAVQNLMTGRTQPRALIPALDTQYRPTLRRNATGDLVRSIQAAVGVSATGTFDAATEAAVRAFQRVKSLNGTALVPDGIVGPKTWAVIDTLPAQPEAGPSAPAASDPDPSPPVSPPPAPSSPVLPPADDAAQPPRVENGKALTPAGAPFAKVWKQGFVTIGQTHLADWVASSGTGAALPSITAVLSASSANEGRLEAVNSYDNAFLSFGVLQWTAGSSDAEGELPALLAALRAASPAAYQVCFGAFGLDLRVDAGDTTGRFVLDGTVLATAAQKAPLRNVLWAYRFWRAGHHPDVRRAQFRHAARRIRTMTRLVVAKRPIGAWLTSERGLAQVFDQHVNRPGHVVATLRAGLDRIGATNEDPAQWTAAREAALLKAYLSAREGTSMTHPVQRAQKIEALVAAGKLKSERGSFDFNELEKI